MAVLVIVAVASSSYLNRVAKLRRRGRHWPVNRTISFLSGLAIVDIALQSPVATYTHDYFQAHVIQHLLLMVVGPPLLALGAPSTLFLQTAKRRNKARWLSIMRSKPFGLVAHPITVWFIYFGSMFAFFLSPLLNFAMHRMYLMDAFNVSFIIGSCFYWWPLVGIDPIVHWRMSHGTRIMSLLVGAAPETFLGIAIMSQRKPIASMYSVASTHTGGGILWASTEVAILIGLYPIVVQWMRSEERIGARQDAITDRASALALANADGSSDYGFAEESRKGLSVTNHPDKPVQPNGHSTVRDHSHGQISEWEAAWLSKTGHLPAMPGSAPLGRGRTGADQA